MNGAADIRCVCLNGTFVRFPNKRLGREMENKVWLCSVDCVPKNRRVANVTDVAVNSRAQAKHLEHRGFCRWRECNSKNFSSKVQQPFTQPRAFETSVARDQNATALVDLSKRHAALPDFPGSLSICPDLIQVLGFLIGIHRLPET